jgi:hypothetical protein
MTNRCTVCLRPAKFKCVCEYWFCEDCSLEELHDGTTIKCSHCKHDICKSFMSTYNELNVCYDCGKLLQKKQKIEEALGVAGRTDNIS